MTATYEARLADLDATWARMIAERDLTGLQRRAFRAIVFALCSVHTPVEQGEYEFTQFMLHNELPEGSMLAEQKSRGIEAAMTWLIGTSVETFATDGWSLADAILRNVYGLGTAKSAFASALCGNPEPYCIDTHCAALIAERMGNTWPDRIKGSIKADKAAGSKAIAAAWRRYRRWGDTTFGARNHQWEFFAFQVPSFRDGGHEAYFMQALDAA